MDLILADLQPAVAVFLFGMSFVGSFVTVTMGIGGGVILLAVMASLLPPAALIPVHGLIQFGSNVNRALVLGRHTHWTPVLAFGLGGAVGAGLGGLVVVDLPASAIQAGVGLFILWSVFLRPPAWLVRWPAVTGGISSFLTMFFGATGVFVAGYVRSMALGRQAHVATQAVLMTMQHLVKIIVFGLLGFVYGPWLGFVAVMIAAGFCGTLAGREVLIRMEDTTFRKVLNTILVLLALRLIWQGISDIWGW